MTHCSHPSYTAHLSRYEYRVAQLDTVLHYLISNFIYHIYFYLSSCFTCSNRPHFLSMHDCVGTRYCDLYCTPLLHTSLLASVFHCFSYQRTWLCSTIPVLSDPSINPSVSGSVKTLKTNSPRTVSLDSGRGDR